MLMLPYAGACSVRVVAQMLHCSTQRVRLLLSQGRLLGHFDQSLKRWHVALPLRLSPGARGPELRSSTAEGSKEVPR